MAGEGYKLVCADLSQIELRLLAHFAKEQNMIDVFWANGDIHTHTACLIFNKPPGKVDPILERLGCKTLNFLVTYQGTGSGFEQQMNTMRPDKLRDPVNYERWPSLWTLDKCNGFVEDWHKAYPSVRPYMAEQTYRCRRYGMTWDLFGGVRRIPQARSYHEHIQEEGLRAAGNMQIQGTAAGVMKLAMVLLGEDIEDRLEWSRPLMTIHDELIHQVEEDRAESFGEYVKLSMEEAGNNGGSGGVEMRFRVPIKCEEKVSERWKK